MRSCTLPVAAALTFIAMGSSLTKACGFEEAPANCGQTLEDDARYMLLRVAVGLKEDTPKVLQQIQDGENGFRTQDNYVFCIGPDGLMSAHPNPLLQGHDVRQVHDSLGHYFFAAMMKTAEPGKIANLRYFRSSPGNTTPVPTTSYYTRVTNQVCGVDAYDRDDNFTSSGPPSSRESLVQIRARLTTSMPKELSADWAEFQRLHDEQVETEDSVLAETREQLQAAAARLTAGKPSHPTAP